MKKVLFALAVISGLCFVSVHAQERGTVSKERPSVANTAAQDWQVTYQQESAKDYIRRRAQDKTAARHARIEGMKWLGHSPARPVVSTTPFMSRAPSWVGVYPGGYFGPAFWPARSVGFTGWLP